MRVTRACEQCLGSAYRNHIELAVVSFFTRRVYEDVQANGTYGQVKTLIGGVDDISDCLVVSDGAVIENNWSDRTCAVKVGARAKTQKIWDFITISENNKWMNDNNKDILVRLRLVACIHIVVGITMGCQRAIALELT